MKPGALLGVLLCLAGLQPAVAASGVPALAPRWQADGNAIVWQASDAHADQLEMSGRQVSAVIAYGRDAQGQLTLKRTVVWPMLRTLPDDTHASLMRDFDRRASPALSIDGLPAEHEVLTQVRFDGQLRLVSDIGGGLVLERLLSPSPDEPALIERLALVNTGTRAVAYRFAPQDQRETTAAGAGTHGAYEIQAASEGGAGSLAPGARITQDVVYSARLANEMVFVDPTEELRKRRQKLQGWNRRLVLETPDKALDLMFGFAKIRAAESIFATRGGLLHSPGGTRYYAAIWANDEAEYANPFFPYLGDAAGIAAAMNSYRLFASYMNPQGRPLPSSVIAEGRSYWNGAGDRGDCAMIAYGASHFALALGDARRAGQLMPLIDWCLKFSLDKRTPDGVIASDSDELEGRFPAGKANLSTNVLAFGGLTGAAMLSAALGQPEDIGRHWQQEAARLRAAIDRYFAAQVGGFDTYRYYAGNDRLRAWIALPLCFGIDERRPGTVAALLSPQLWSENGVLSEAGDTTFWDRATLYAFRGLMQAGELERVFPYFVYYSKRRLLGEHVPYAIEAWPEGNQRHLSAESALYARVVTEGLFGLQPTGLRSFRLAPRLPAAWQHMALRNIRAFGLSHADGEEREQGLDILTRRSGSGQQVEVFLRGQRILSRHWDGRDALGVTLPE
ncbi:hypothetical protein [Roseateles saccharophilus]|uniref:Uncharacterized protein n=1 Tax=Roseateles saccharophilus TaxID=304 RepID=A0A4R3VEI0_ROSSA|nr:hypothetical protein [Roseateles saccharophilus]MDG0833002.1 hypothetical protein [Roseateles saccharophilus]TCV02094.1 hypothetical protein EV671_1005129 [Roseateles saccharophilus]